MALLYFAKLCRCFAGYLLVLLSSSLYAKGCYTSIISFGDSLADTGNIKHIGTITGQAFSSLSPPYGQTFFHKPTGRCSDGRLIIDFLAESLGLPFISPYMHEGSGNVAEFEHGVNYAVVGATAMSSQLLASEGVYLNLAINTSLKDQLEWFKHSLPSICGNASDCRNVIGRSLILLGEIGGNDYNIPVNYGKSIKEIESFAPLVVNAIIFAIKLVEMGAQTLVVPGNFPIGCSPSYLTVFGSSKNEEYDPTTGCLVWLNQFAEYHNQLLQKELDKIRELHPDVNIIYADYYNAAMQIYRFPYEFGFTNGALKACCGGGGPFNYNLSATCGHEYASVCDEPNKYVSWDGVHLTEAAYKVIFKGLFQGSYATPAFSYVCRASS